MIHHYGETENIILGRYNIMYVFFAHLKRYIYMKHKYDIGRYKYQFNHRTHCIIDTTDVQYDLEYIITEYAPIDIILNYGKHLINKWESIDEKK